MAPQTPLLDQVKLPADLRKLEESQLRQLADELRAETISAVSVTGGHLGAGLGVVELTVALHYVFNTPKDVVIWDVGHQALGSSTGVMVTLSPQPQASVSLGFLNTKREASFVVS